MGGGFDAVRTDTTACEQRVLAVRSLSPSLSPFAEQVAGELFSTKRFIAPRLDYL